MVDDLQLTVDLRQFVRGMEPIMLLHVPPLGDLVIVRQMLGHIGLSVDVLSEGVQVLPVFLQQVLGVVVDVEPLQKLVAQVSGVNSYLLLARLFLVSSLLSQVLVIIQPQTLQRDWQLQIQQRLELLPIEGRDPLHLSLGQLQSSIKLFLLMLLDLRLVLLLQLRHLRNLPNIVRLGPVGQRSCCFQVASLHLVLQDVLDLLDGGDHILGLLGTGEPVDPLSPGGKALAGELLVVGHVGVELVLAVGDAVDADRVVVGEGGVVLELLALLGAGEELLRLGIHDGD